jgi:phospholipid-binding lipoprotein MlaA
MRFTKILKNTFLRGFALCSIGVLAGCSTPQTPVEIHDPFEKTNRQIHGFNKSVDRAILRPVSNGYGTILPQTVRTGVGNFAANLSLPSQFVNTLLQGDVGGAARNFSRFAMNTTLGLGGLLDPATKAGLEQERADFGETLATWGAPEGAYIELPLLGGSTQRETLGKVVDLFTNPLSLDLNPPENLVAPVAGGLARLGDRYTLTGMIDQVLYESADSYAQARSIYLQSRRFQLGTPVASPKSTTEDTYDDLFN